MKIPSRKQTCFFGIQIKPSFTSSFFYFPSASMWDVKHLKLRLLNDSSLHSHMMQFCHAHVHFDPPPALLIGSYNCITLLKDRPIFMSSKNNNNKSAHSTTLREL